VQRAYSVSSRLLSVLVFLLGLAMITATLARGGGGLALGVVLGAGFMVLGAGRLWLASAGRR